MTWTHRLRERLYIIVRDVTKCYPVSEILGGMMAFVKIMKETLTVACVTKYSNPNDTWKSMHNYGLLYVYILHFVSFVTDNITCEEAFFSMLQNNI